MNRRIFKTIFFFKIVPSSYFKVQKIQHQQKFSIVLNWFIHSKINLIAYSALHIYWNENKYVCRCIIKIVIPFFLVINEYWNNVLHCNIVWQKRYESSSVRLGAFHMYQDNQNFTIGISILNFIGKTCFEMIWCP